MAGELAEDDSAGTSPEEEFKIKIFFVIVDRAVQTMESRFVQHKSLYLDLACFDPKRFKSQESLPPKALKKIELLLNVDEEKLKEELISFMNVWPQISNASMNADYEYEDVSDEKIDDHSDDDDDQEEDDDEDHEIQCKASASCNSCIKCAYKIILEYNMYCLQYPELSKVYKFLLTIPLTQVSCERAFSKLKLIKTRLRSSLTNENLESLLLMHSEADILNSIDPDTVIDYLCHSSSELKRLLQV
jgi:hypothetical protein